ncbi:class I SAM-dependent methyltransferase [Burkholderia oklahomensis]|uniref:class I SAM-dependent DNA methyltransferase n=1 Tax=Burkholderia oklahomensis TaxID=342113 RepID=UPI00265500E7|nr:class I SAM-dependent methyltransferase [Burkholderia oklahomensis]MDN7672263.1 class I SAM-dependent methyltransferase [Burkholderia oklahomensis]
MHDSKENLIVTDSHQLGGNNERLAKFYDDWAHGYEATAAGEEYVGYLLAAKLLDFVHQVYSDARRDAVQILDAGCGTGLVGGQLAKYGYAAIDGVDLSAGMIDVARKRGVYRRLVGDVDLNGASAQIATGRYDYTVCCGVFIDGHVKVDALRELLRATKPGGHVVASVRESYLASEPFASYLDGLVRDGVASIAFVVENGRYINVNRAHYYVIRKADDRKGAANGAA